MRSHAQLAKHVQAAYLATPSVEGSDDVRAVFTHFADELVVAITGTLTVPGWIRDFEFLPERDVRIGRCHSGFLHNGNALWALIKGEVLFAESTGKRVTYAGHSLGAAEAQICAALHVAYGARNIRVVAFGSPRVALWINRTFRALLAGRDVTLYKRAGDRVPHVPPSFWYGHVRLNVILGAVVPGSDVNFPLDPVNDPNHGIALYAADLTNCD